MKNILVTGANGQLGNEIRILSQNNKEYNYFFTDVNELDICNEGMVAEFVIDNSIDVIINCAAYTAVDKAEDNEELCDKLNNIAVGNLAAAAERNSASLIHISTDYVFDGTNHIPYKEDEETSPASVYGRTKLAGERRAMDLCSHCMIIRTAWLYSEFGNNFVKTMMKLGKEKESLGVVFDQIGTPTYAKDLAEVVFAAINKGVVPGIYHFSNEGVCSWFDFTKAIFRLSGITGCNLKPLHTYEYPYKAHRPHFSVLDKTKIKETYGIEVSYWEDSLKECINELTK